MDNCLVTSCVVLIILTNLRAADVNKVVGASLRVFFNCVLY